MITSRANPLIKMARGLRQSRARHETGLFLVEGLQPVGAAIEADWEIEALLYVPRLLGSKFADGLLARYRGRLEEVSETVLESVAEKEHPQGIVAIARQRHTTLASTAPGRLGAALVSAQDPGNVGTILRTLEAAGGPVLYLLDGGVDPYHPTAIRAAMGATFAITVIEAQMEEFLAWRKTHGVHLIGTSARAERDYREVKPRQPWILLLGNEQKGLSDIQRQACDVVVSLPMRGRASSLNLAVAAGILLFAYAE